MRPETEPRQESLAEGDQNANPQEAQVEKKKKKTIALKPEHLETGKGLKKLYELTKEVRWEDSVTTESAMNQVVMTLKTWQNQLLPKYYYEYFLQRCQALGNNKAYLTKVRRIHKGQDVWGEDKDEQGLPIQEKEEEKNKQNGHGGEQKKKNTSDKEGEDFDIGLDFEPDYEEYENAANDMEKFKNRSELAQKLAYIPPETKTAPKAQEKVSKTSEEEIIDCFDEDLRMFVEMNRKKNEKKKVDESDGEIELDIGDSAIDGLGYDFDYDD